jgi:hypothetical protein
MARKLLLLATSLAFVLGLLEAAFRILDLEVHDWNSERAKVSDFQVLNPKGDYFSNPPNSSAQFWGTTSTFNSLGMRDVEPAAVKAPGTCRIVTLGDSVTMGEGVAQNQTFTYGLRELLAGRKVEIVGAGVSGWNTTEEERFLRTNLDRLDPDLVVLTYVVNDYEPYNSIRRDRERERTWSDRIFEVLILRSRFFEWSLFTYHKMAGPNLDGMKMFVRWDAMLKASGPPFAPDDPGWNASREALLRMRDSLSARGAKLVIFLYHLGPLPLEAVALERLREFSRDSGVQVIDTLPFFTGHSWKEIVLNPVMDPHPNAQGHALLAKGIAQSLETAGLLDCAQR